MLFYLVHAGLNEPEESLGQGDPLLQAGPLVDIAPDIVQKAFYSSTALVWSMLCPMYSTRQGCGSGSVWVRINLSCRIRIRIQVGKNDLQI
jgi:hypothetical protein